MGRKRASKVEKSPYKLRQRTLADGRVSLFIDHAVNGKHEYEFLKLYLLPETSEKIRRENARTLRKAEEIIHEKCEALIEDKAESVKNLDKSCILLCDYIDILITRYKERGMNTYKCLITARKALEIFSPGCRLCDIDKKFCIAYRDWLLSYCSPRTGRPLAKKTAFSYFWQLADILSNAIYMGYIKNNPWKLLETSDKMTEPPTTRDFLTIEEVEILEKTPYRHENIRRAFLFCCFCGLRISDMLNLRWQNISRSGDTVMLSFMMKKTAKPISVPLSSKAIGYLPERGDALSDSLIFAGLPCENSIRLHLKKWAKQCGICKNIHFHMSRHTFGTMLITAGVDLYTASKMLGHSDVRATQVYAKIIDRKKAEAMDLLDSVL